MVEINATAISAINLKIISDRLRSYTEINALSIGSDSISSCLIWNSLIEDLKKEHLLTFPLLSADDTRLFQE